MRGRGKKKVVNNMYATLHPARQVSRNHTTRSGFACSVISLGHVQKNRLNSDIFSEEVERGLGGRVAEKVDGGNVH